MTGFFLLGAQRALDRARPRPMRATAALLVAVLGLPAAGGAAESTAETLGDVGQLLLPASALTATLVHRDGQGVRQLGRAGLAAFALVRTLKPVVGRSRPDGGRQSFPSGHAAGAFVGAAFLQRRYGWSYGLPAYAAAGFVAYSRVRAGRHWTTDVVAGGSIGIAANLVFTDQRRTVVVVRPLLDRRAVGAVLQATW